MRFTVSYSSDRGGGALAVLEEVLAEGADRFGQALSRVRITIALPAIDDEERWLATMLDGMPPDERAFMEPHMRSNPTDTAWAEAAEEYERGRRRLPTARFDRSGSVAEIAVASHVQQYEVEPGPPAPNRLAALLDDVLVGLGLLREQVTSGDDLDLEGFLAHCERARARLPRNAVDYDWLEQRAFAREVGDDERWQAADVDWASYDARARELLDDPFFWDPSLSRSSSFAGC